jgi:hypothetical protein
MGILYIGAIAGTQVKAFDVSDTQAWEASAVPLTIRVSDCHFQG